MTTITKEQARNAANESQDPMYDQAVEVVLKNRRASISLVQRHLKIGYNRAACLLEDMEKAGLVSHMRGGGYRDILAPDLSEAPSESEADRDAARYRWLRRKMCFTGNGDGTASMHAINLPDSAAFPEVGKVSEGVDAAIDAAMAKEKANG